MARILEFLVEFCAGILDLRNSSLRNSRIPYYVIPQSLWGSLYGILDFGKFFLGILDFRILEFLGNSKLALSFKLRGSGSKN